MLTFDKFQKEIQIFFNNVFPRNSASLRAEGGHFNTLFNM
jgi:hypothetical protein